MPRRQAIRVFVGFQLESAFHRPSDLRALMKVVGGRLSRRNVDLEATFGRFPAGESLWESVRESIGRADVALFDVSENNPNVMLEAGLALGSSKRIVMLKSLKSDAGFKRPSDLVDYLYIPYQDSRDLRSPRVCHAVEAGILNAIQRHRSPDRSFREVWGFGEFDVATVVCSELDEAEERQHPEPWEFIYLSKYGDQDALIEALTTIHELYPTVHVSYMTGTELWEQRENDALAGNLVLVGGPDYNRMTRALERYCPFEYSEAGGDNNISIRLKRGGQKFTPRRTETSPEEYLDYGFFVSRRNPYNLQKRLVIVGGCHTRGVYGAIRAFRFLRRDKDPIAESNCRTVALKVGPNADFFALFEVRGYGKTIPTPKVNPAWVWRLA